MADLSLWQQAAVALCEFACGWPHGVGKDEAPYPEVTEGRDLGMNRAHYSSCGDLPHWLFERLGLCEKWINRQSLGHYHVGLNIAELGLGCPISHAAPVDPAWPGPGVGDVCEIWNGTLGQDAHVFVVLGPGSDVNHLRTANYGAGGMSSSAFPGGLISDSHYEHRGGAWYVGTRRLQRIIRFADAVALSTAQPDLAGAAVSGELIDALGAKWEPLKP